MRERKTTRRRAKLALILIGGTACTAGAGYAATQAGHSPATPVNAQGPAASKSAATDPPSRPLSIRVTPLTRSVAPGDTAEFAVRLRERDRRRVRLSVIDGVPRRATAFFTPTSTRKSRATLKVITTGAPSGGHRLRLLARSGRRGGTRRATAAVNLVISSVSSSTQHTNFTISGDLPSSSPLEPGLSVPFDLSLTNPGPVEIAISGLEVSVGDISAPNAAATFPCTAADFSVSQFSGGYGFTLPATSTRSLSELGFAGSQLPQVEMWNRPVNQNGCKGASLQFDFSGTATEVAS
jgi:hypothetical protein